MKLGQNKELSARIESSFRGFIDWLSGRGYGVRQILETLLDVDDFHEARVTFDASRPSTVPVRLMDNGLARSLLGFEAKTSLADGLKRTLAWYRKNQAGLQVPRTAP